MRYKLSVFALILSLSLSTPLVAIAQDPGSTPKNQPTTSSDSASPSSSTSQFHFETPSSLKFSPFNTVSSAVAWLFKTAIALGSIAFVILFLVAGVQYLAGAGSEDNTKKAGKLMLNAVIGLFLILTSWAVGTYVLGLLGLSIS